MLFRSWCAPAGRSLACIVSTANPWLSSGHTRGKDTLPRHWAGELAAGGDRRPSRVTQFLVGRRSGRKRLCGEGRGSMAFLRLTPGRKTFRHRIRQARCGRKQDHLTRKNTLQKRFVTPTSGLMENHPTVATRDRYTGMIENP